MSSQLDYDMSTINGPKVISSILSCRFFDAMSKHWRVADAAIGPSNRRIGPKVAVDW